MKVSVVILNWNGCDMLRTFLPSVIQYSEGKEIEICVADNGSTDDSVTMIQREFPSVRMILLEQNHGFADGYNLALFDPDLFECVETKVYGIDTIDYRKHVI